MADEVSHALAALGLRDHYTAPQDRVFGSADGAHVDLSGFRDRFHAAQDRAKVAPRRDVRQLRNTFGTVCASEGVRLRAIQEWMGHESIRTTEIYASFMPRHEDAAIVSRAFGRGKRRPHELPPAQGVGSRRDAGVSHECLAVSNVRGSDG